MPKKDGSPTYAERKKQEAESRRVELRKQARKNRLLSRERFKHSEVVVARYRRALMSIAKHVGSIVKTMAPNGVVENMTELERLLTNYSEILDPYARKVAESMLEKVDSDNEKAWRKNSEEMGILMKKQVERSKVSATYKRLMEEQVTLIKSLPLEEAQRVHKLSTEALSNATRASEIAKEILKTGHVTASRAMTIARTETSRASTNLTEARAKLIGSPGYIWRTAGDADVRELHQHLEGQFISWDDPPVAGSRGERAHAGAIYNCRCYPEVLLPDTVD